MSNLKIIKVGGNIVYFETKDVTDFGCHKVSMKKNGSFYRGNVNVVARFFKNGLKFLLAAPKFSLAERNKKEKREKIKTVENEYGENTLFFLKSGVNFTHMFFWLCNFIQTFKGLKYFNVLNVVPKCCMISIYILY